MTRGACNGAAAWLAELIDLNLKCDCTLSLQAKSLCRIALRREPGGDLEGMGPELLKRCHPHEEEQQGDHHEPYSRPLVTETDLEESSSH
jgi:hypothetical protein